MRINDYFFNQFLGALTDANPFQKTIDALLLELQNQLDQDTSMMFKVTTPNNFGALADEATKFISKHSGAQQPTTSKHFHHQVEHPAFKSAQTLNEDELARKQKLFYEHSNAHRNNSIRVQTDNKKHALINKEIDLKQQKSCAFINLSMNRPLLIIKDRPYLPNQIEIDLGKISIQSQTLEVNGRWKNHELTKVWVTQFIINMKEMSFLYNKTFKIAPQFDMNIVFEKPNYTPLIQEAFVSTVIDFQELDMGYKININFSPFIMRLKQDVYTYLLRCNDLNFNYTDGFSKYFQLAIWNNGEDSQKYIKHENEIVRLHKNKEVFKMKIFISFPSLVLQVHNNKTEQYLAEVILWNADFDFFKYIDYRKTIALKAHTFFILHSPQNGRQDEQVKQVAIAPVNSNNYITTDKEFYNFEVQERVNKLSPNKRAKAMQKYSKKNFKINMHLEADGEKLIQVKIEKLKIFIKPHIYLMIFEIFTYGMPQYTQDSRDKPNFYDSDWGNAPKMEIGCQILQSLLCFEIDQRFEKTIACQGNSSFTYIREKMNLIKKKLVEQPQIQGMINESNDLRRNSYTQTLIDTSSTYKLMQVSISDLCPFFCHPYDLDGKNFKQVRKREMMSPFTLFYNKQEIIELQVQNERSKVFNPELIVFKKYNKVEANLERTLLKISFNDIKVIKGISDYMFYLLNQEYLRLVSDAQEVQNTICKKRNINETSLTPQKTIQVQGKHRQSSLLIDGKMRQTLKQRKSVQLRIPQKTKTLIDKPEGDLSQQDSGHESDYSADEERKSSLENSEIDEEEEEDEYFDDEEQFKINQKLERNKDLMLSLKKSKSPDSKGQYSSKINNLTESVRRASIAFNMFQESYFLRNAKKETENFNIKCQDELAQQYELIHQIHQENKLYPSPVILQEGSVDTLRNITIHEKEDEDSNSDDLDEGDRAIFTQSSLDIVQNETPLVTKKLLSTQNQESNILKVQQSIQQHINDIKEEQGVNQFQIVSYGLKILIINDSQQNFFPVLGISISEFHFSSDQNDTQKAGQTQFSSSINYYNPEAGEWEPFVETFRVHITIMEELTSSKKILQCEIPSNLNMNITQKLVQNLSDTFKSWLESTQSDDAMVSDEESLADNQDSKSSFKLKNDSQQNSSSLQEDEESFLQADRGGTRKKAKYGAKFSQKSNYVYQDYDDDDENENYDKEQEEVVTPYSICNQTNVKLLVKRLNNPNSYEKRGIDSDEKRHKPFNYKNEEKTSSSYRNQGAQSNIQSKLNRVYVINPDSKIDYAVDYELQVRQQINMYNSHQFTGHHGEFVKILFNDSSTSDRQAASNMSIPLNCVNLNQIGFKRHFIKDDDPQNRQEENEFYIYGVQQVNMKKVLTLRTQYLFINQTFFSYDVHVRFSTTSIIKTLGPGDRFPFPNIYNKCKFQIRISPLKSTSDNQSNRSSGNTTRERKTQGIQSLQSQINSSRQRRINESSIEELIQSGRDIPNFQVISKNWSDLFSIKALKYNLPINKVTFLKHGRTFSIIKKEVSVFPDAYDIVIRPPLLLKNCLPVPILIEYEDSNGDFDRLDLQKQEEKHVFVFNLQQQVMLKFMIEGFAPGIAILECSQDKDIEIKCTIYDVSGKPLDIYISTSGKVAGRKAIFYVKNMIINNTDDKLSFYYEQPSERQIKSKSCKEGVAECFNQSDYQRGQFFMLSDRHEIYAHLDGSQEVSNPINIYNPGCKDRFILPKGDALHEYSYSTEIFLATKDDYVYTKITTISPQYVIVNSTRGQLFVCQQGANDDCAIAVLPKCRVPFHWANGELDKLIKVKYDSSEIEEELEWTCGFSINEVGQITVKNRQKMPSGWKLDDLDRRLYYQKYLRVDRKFHKNTIFIIIEEENSEQPFYKIENISSKYSLRYFQQGFLSTSDLLNVNSSASFAWSDMNSVHKIQVQIFKGDLDNDETYLLSDVEEMIFPLDELNFKHVIMIPKESKLEETCDKLYVWTFTDGFTKVIRFSDKESKNQFNNEVREDENQQKLSMVEVYVKNYTLSLVGDGKELFALYLQGIMTKVMETEKERKLEFKIGYLQLDNQSENDPIYPVIIKPKYIKPDPTIVQSSQSDQDDESSVQSQVNNKSSAKYNFDKGVFEFYVDIKKNVPNVMYFELIEYLLQSIELKLEFSHILMISKFMSKIGQILNQNLTYMHQVFDSSDHPSPDRPEEDASPGRRLSTSMIEDEGFSESLRRHSPSKKHRLQMDPSQVTQSRDLMKEKKLHFGQQKPVQIITPYDKQQTIASSLQLLRHASTKVEHNYQQENEQMGSALETNYNKKGTQYNNGSPKRLSSLSKRKNQEIIEKMKIQDNIKVNTLVKIHRDNWKEEQFEHKSNRIYIKEYRASPFEFIISVMNKANFELEDEQDILKTISSLGLVISSIDEAPITVNALFVENIFGNQSDVIEQLKNHHTTKLKWNLLKLIGASNLLGNPMNFVNALGTGVQDFFYQPQEGFTRGTLQGGIGIIKGTTSLVTNTFVGVIGSASKMASSVSKGLLVLSNDTDYIYKRDVENIKKRPKNVLQGLKLGLNQAIGSIGSGIVGVVAQPIEETKKGGFFGFFKGTVKGVAGLVVKPLSGTLDLFSQTTEGIKNTSKKDEELVQDKRLRLPRPLYETEQIIREYDEFHAFWLNSIPKIAPELSTMFFFDAFLIDCTDFSWSVLVLTLDNIALIHTELRQDINHKNPKQQKSPVQIKWIIQTQQIRYIEVIDERILAVGFDAGVQNLPLNDSYITEKIRFKIEKIMKSHDK